ncbi:MAG: ribonuclease HII [Promethearchaeota archaeon]
MQIGSVLGSMVICGVCFIRPNLDFLSEIGVKDSKKLSAKKRNQLSKIIKDKCYSHKIIVVTPEEIDQREKRKITINQLEELKMAEIINELKPDIIYIDAADVNEKRFGRSIQYLLNYKPKRIISKHKADDIYPIVSAGSIIAKDKRDMLINELKKSYGEFGSGYPSDIRTIKFLREWIKSYRKPPAIARKSWNTTKNIINQELLNRKITEFY